MIVLVQAFYDAGHFEYLVWQGLGITWMKSPNLALNEQLCNQTEVSSEYTLSKCSWKKDGDYMDFKIVKELF